MPAPIDPNKKVAILGSASTSVDLAPYDNPEFEFWGLAWRADLKKKTRVFDMHVIDAGRAKIPQNYHEFLVKHDVPVFLVEEHPKVPKSVNYPIDEVIAFLSEVDAGGHAQGDYFVSSVAYMIALAMYEGYGEIHLYGIDLIDDDEYAYQRPNTEYLIGLARGLGHKVYIPNQSALLKYTHRYGYEKNLGEGIITISVLNHRIQKYKERMERAMAEAHTCDGAIQEAKALITVLKHHQRGVPDGEADQPNS